MNQWAPGQTVVCISGAPMPEGTIARHADDREPEAGKSYTVRWSGVYGPEWGRWAGDPAVRLEELRRPDYPGFPDPPYDAARFMLR